MVYLLTQRGPGSATQILPVLAYQLGIQAGALGRGAAIALFLLPGPMPRCSSCAPSRRALPMPSSSDHRYRGGARPSAGHVLIYLGVVPFV